MIGGSHPILSCAEARKLESDLFAGGEAQEWAAMQRAGRAIARAVVRDFDEIGGFPAHGTVLVLAGKGHNGGDALIAARTLLQQFPGASAAVGFAFGERALRPLAARAWRELEQAAEARVCRWLPGAKTVTPHTTSVGFALCLDGVFGFQFRAPVDERIAALFAAVAALPIRLRAAIDLPSGLGPDTKAGDPVLRADFTYATGSVKAPVINGLNLVHVGRLRYLDLGFFTRDEGASRLRVLTPDVLAPMSGLRRPASDKRDYGHLFIVGGSLSYPGAVLMSVLGALRSGVGLVTVFVPESLVASFAARAPEAMWVGWPETPAGALALEGESLLARRIEGATALLIGPGLGRESETRALVAGIVKTSTKPLLLDADALQPEIIRAGAARRILTPHLGELRRMLPGDDFYRTTVGKEAVVVVKGPLTAITTGAGREGYYSPFGGPVLARGGSGDVLAGLMGGLLAQNPAETLLAAARGVVWHGMAADALARAHGQVAAHTTQLIEFLPTVLREIAAAPDSD
ncbi:MAG: hypothetical protein RIQ93_1526 [Verrucomicrobiota bacterium]|jgi:NAD(P)H-hydrate epimerase